MKDTMDVSSNDLSSTAHMTAIDASESNTAIVGDHVVMARDFGVMARDFGVMSLVSVSWNMVNVFGGLSYIFVVGFSAGGLPAIIYGL